MKLSAKFDERVLTMAISILAILLMINLISCHKGKETETEMKGANVMKISSPAFSNEGDIPSIYTCDGANYSPPLQWTGVPESAKSLALIADDPDAPMGTWVHWVIYNIPVTTEGLAEQFSLEPELPDGTLQGMTDFGRVGYGGPCPPSGTHRYYFKLFALDTTIDSKPGIVRADLLKAMEGHILDSATLMGTYHRN